MLEPNDFCATIVLVFAGTSTYLCYYQLWILLERRRFCYNRQMFLLRPFMTSCDPRRRRQRFCCNRRCFLLRRTSFFATSVLWCDWCRLYRRNSCRRRRGQGRRTGVLQPWTVCDRSAAGSGAQTESGGGTRQAPSPETTCGLTVVSSGDPTSVGDPVNADDLASFVLSFPS